jgi:hypothetical protein
MKFLKTVQSSVYDLQFYAEIKKQTLGDALKYFAQLVFALACLSAIMPIIFGVGLLTWNQSAVTNFEAQIVQAFPAELSIEAKNGEVTTNVEEPYAIAMPESFKSEFTSSDATATPPRNIIVINTHKSIELSDFAMQDTIAIVGKNEVGIFDAEKNKVDIQSLNNFSTDGPINQAAFAVLLENMWGVARIAAVVILALLPVLIFGAFFVAYGLYLFFGALFVWLASSLTKKSLTYKESYVASLHLITLPLIGSFVLPFIFQAPFMFTIVLFVIAYINFNQTVVKDDADTKEAPTVSSDVPELLQPVLTK